MPYSVAIWVITTVAVVSIAMLELAGRVFARGAIALITPNFDAVIAPTLEIRANDHKLLAVLRPLQYDVMT